MSSCSPFTSRSAAKVVSSNRMWNFFSSSCSEPITCRSCSWCRAASRRILSNSTCRRRRSSLVKESFSAKALRSNWAMESNWKWRECGEIRWTVRLPFVSRFLLPSRLDHVRWWPWPVRIGDLPFLSRSVVSNHPSRESIVEWFPLERFPTHDGVSLVHESCVRCHLHALDGADEWWCLYPVPVGRDAVGVDRVFERTSRFHCSVLHGVAELRLEVVRGEEVTLDSRLPTALASHPADWSDFELRTSAIPNLLCCKRERDFNAWCSEERRRHTRRVKHWSSRREERWARCEKSLGWITYRAQTLIVTFSTGEIHHEITAFFRQFFFLLVQTHIVITQSFDVFLRRDQIFGQRVLQSSHLKSQQLELWKSKGKGKFTCWNCSMISAFSLLTMLNSCSTCWRLTSVNCRRWRIAGWNKQTTTVSSGVHSPSSLTVSFVLHIDLLLFDAHQFLMMNITVPDIDETRLSLTCRRVDLSCSTSDFSLWMEFFSCSTWEEKRRWFFPDPSFLLTRRMILFNSILSWARPSFNACTLQRRSRRAALSLRSLPRSCSTSARYDSDRDKASASEERTVDAREEPLGTYRWRAFLGWEHPWPTSPCDTVRVVPWRPFSIARFCSPDFRSPWCNVRSLSLDGSCPSADPPSLLRRCRVDVGDPCSIVADDRIQDGCCRSESSMSETARNRVESLFQTRTDQSNLLHVRSFVVGSLQRCLRTITFVCGVIELFSQLIDLQLVTGGLLVQLTTFSIALVQLIFQLLNCFSCCAQLGLQIMNLNDTRKTQSWVKRGLGWW